MRTFVGFQKGVNLGGWFSQCDYSEDRLNNFIVEDDIRTIASWGVDHVRLPVDYNVVEDEQGNYVESGFQRIERAVDWCRKYGLNVVLDLHKTAGYAFHRDEGEKGFFENPTLQERFYRLWEEFAKRFGDRPEQVAFELLNEVTEPSCMANWMRIAKTAFEHIRKYAPRTRIIVSGYWYSCLFAVKDIDAPWDENIVYNFHCYDPSAFTHQHAEFVYQTDVSKDVSYAESGATTEYFHNRFAEAVQVATERNVPLYCGEYGVIQYVCPEDALLWFKAIHEAFEKNGIARAAWTYRQMHFGLSDERMKPVIDELIKYL